MPFEPGKSGNPAGRPRGATSTTIIREALEQVFTDGEKGLLAAICESAKSGDLTACALLINRLYPQLKPVQPMSVFSLGGTTPSDQAQSILQAVADGVLPADIGVQLISAVGRVLEIREITELAQRLEELEKRIQQSKTN